MQVEAAIWWYAGIIWADRVAPRGTEAATGCEELAIVTMKKTHKEKYK